MPLNKETIRDALEQNGRNNLETYILPPTIDLAVEPTWHIVLQVS